MLGLVFIEKTTFHSNASSRVEGVNGKIKPFIPRNASMYDFLAGIFKYLEFKVVQKDEIDEILSGNKKSSIRKCKPTSSNR